MIMVNKLVMRIIIFYVLHILELRSEKKKKKILSNGVNHWLFLRVLDDNNRVLRYSYVESPYWVKDSFLD